MSISTAANIASYVIDKCVRDGEPVSNLQLQKILFFVQERFCEVAGEPLFDDDFEAWMYGPVVPAIYKTYSIWGGSKIDWKFDIDFTLPEFITNVIDPVIEEKRSIAPWRLVDQTHTEDSAWYKVHNSLGDGAVIPKQMIFGK